MSRPSESLRPCPSPLPVRPARPSPGKDIRSEPFRIRRELLEELANENDGTLELSPGTIDPGTAATWFEELPATGIKRLVIRGAGQAMREGNGKKSNTASEAMSCFFAPEPRNNHLSVSRNGNVNL